MISMSMRERILAVVQGREHDRVPFVMYEGILPVGQVQDVLGRECIGILRWSRVHREEHPHCHVETTEWIEDGTRWQRNTLHTPDGVLYQDRAFEAAYGSSSVRKHYIEDISDYRAFWAYLNDCIILADYDRYYQDAKDLGETGVPLVAVERTPYQQLWVQWVGLDTLGFHMVDAPDIMSRTMDLLRERARGIFAIAAASPAPFIDFPDNITAPAIGPERFERYCVPLYNELAEMLGPERPVFVHMDGDLKPLWDAIGRSRVGGLDSLAPAPDNDTSVSDAVRLWPDMKLFVNFPSSVHLLPAQAVGEEAMRILDAAGDTGRLQIQVSENVPHSVWRTSLPAIAAAIQEFAS